VERIGTTSTSGSEQGVVHDSSTKRSSASSGKGIGGTTTEHESTDNGSSGNTSNHTSSQTGNKAYRESTSTSRLNIATGVVGNITSRNGTVLGDGANDVKDQATTIRIADRLMTYICFVTYNRSVDTGNGQIESSTVAGINGAQVVVITKIDINGGENTSSSTIARIVGTSIVIIARGDRCVDTLSTSDVTRILAHIGSASVGIIALTIVVAVGNRRTKVGEVDDTSFWDTLVIGTVIVRRYRDSC